MYEINSRLPYKPDKINNGDLINIKASTLNEWRSRLGYPTYGTTASTLQNTTQLIPSHRAETREYMRDYYKTRAWALKPRRINDNMYTDTFYSSLPYVRGYKWFQLFAFKRTKLIKIILIENNPKPLRPVRILSDRLIHQSELLPIIKKAIQTLNGQPLIGSTVLKLA